MQQVRKQTTPHEFFFSAWKTFFYKATTIKVGGKKETHTTMAATKKKIRQIVSVIYLKVKFRQSFKRERDVYHLGLFFFFVPPGQTFHPSRRSWFVVFFPKRRDAIFIFRFLFKDTKQTERFRKAKKLLFFFKRNYIAAAINILCHLFPSEHHLIS